MAFRFLSFIFGREPVEAQRIPADDIEKAIKLVVAGTDKRIALISGYEKKLRRPVIKSLLYIEQQLEHVPGPFGASRKAFGSTPQINALFATADDMREIFSRSDKLQTFFNNQPGAETVFFSLGMVKREKQTFGAEMHGDMLHKDVAQTTVSFSGHWIGVCGDSEAAVKAQMRWRAFNTLVTTALERITKLKTTTADLESQRILLKTKLDNLKRQNTGLESLADDSWMGGEAWQKLQNEMVQTESELEKQRAGLSTLDDYLGQVKTVLANPWRYLKGRPKKIYVNRLGIKDESEDNEEHAVVTAQVEVSTRAPFELVLLTYPRTEMRPASDYRDEMNSFLR